jgi:glycosyltransferase involved in cell wall biosynthesis
LRILFLSDNFPPEVNAPASRTFEHCREWVRAGHQVTVITCAPNFPKGQVFDGYRNRLCGKETVDGIEVVRVWSYITANEGVLKRTLDYVSFMLSASLMALFVRRPDVIVATSPQFFTACAGWLVSRLRGRPYVFELRDLWPESIRAVGAIRNEGILHKLEALELFLYRGAAAVVCVTQAFRRNLIGRGITPEKIAVVTNGADLSRFEPRPKDQALGEALGLQGCFVAGYVGTHGMAHALETLLEAAARLAKAPGGERIRLLLLGDGSAKAQLVAKAKAMGLTNVVFVDTVSKDEVARYWSLLDVSIIHLKHTELFTTVIPSKLFECMAMGIPVLHGVAGESAEIVERDGAGLVFTPEDDAALTERLLQLAGDESMRAGLAASARAAAGRYDRKTLAGDMLAVLERVAKGEVPVPGSLPVETRL